MKNDKDTNIDLGTIHRTLFSAGFVVTNFSRKPSYIAFHVFRSDEFGVKANYLIAFCDGGKFSPTDCKALQRSATYRSEYLVLVGSIDDLENNKIPVISPEVFYQRLGGTVSSYLPLESYYPEHLEILGRNKLPAGLTGKADEWFEEYVFVGLQFLLQNRVIKYGQDRLFKELPDGIAFGGAVLLLYDCKAAGEGYKISSSSMRQFADYINTFHRRYQNYVGRVNSFLVISGFFQHPDSLEDRSRELVAECGVPLSFLGAKVMGEIIKLFVEHPVYRQSIDWKRVFSGGIIQTARVIDDLRERRKDGVIRS
jgi:hypothetical protein